MCRHVTVKQAVHVDEYKQYKKYTKKNKRIRSVLYTGNWLQLAAGQKSSSGAKSQEG